MYVKKVKRKCSVRGCKNTECFAISRTREVGNTVIICKSCLEKALGAVDEIDPKTKSNIPVAENKGAPSLFFNAKALGSETETEAVSKTPAEDTQSDADDATPSENEERTSDESDNKSLLSSEYEINDNVFVCTECGKTFDSEKGLKTHLRYCKPQTDEE